ncbi:MAG: Ig-like domain-containing protein, partial [Gammaproteobacteria bacterium]
DEAFRYTSVSITQPEQSETVWNTGGNITIRVAVAPKLRRGDSVNVLYDGQKVQRLNSSPATFTLAEVFRGEHTLQAVVVDINGTEVKKCNTVTFYVQQTSVNRRR